jgi:hypothetical protein
MGADGIVDFGGGMTKKAVGETADLLIDANREIGAVQ